MSLIGSKECLYMLEYFLRKPAVVSGEVAFSRHKILDLFDFDFISFDDLSFILFFLINNVR